MTTDALPGAELDPRELYRLVAETAQDVITILDPKGGIVYVSPSVERVLGYDPEALVGTPLRDLIHPDDLAGADAALRTTIAVGSGAASDLRIRHKDGRWRTMEGIGGAARDEDGNAKLVVTASRDITERRDASERLRFVAEASALLSQSLDLEETLAGIARLAIPTLADWCIVDVLDADGQTIRQVAVAAAAPEKEEVLNEMRRLYQPTVDSPQPAARALREGTSSFFPIFTAESLRETTRDEHHYQLMTVLAPLAAVAVPMIARGHTVGAITFCFAESMRTYTDSDLALAEELANRAALAADNAALYEAAQDEIAERKRVDDERRFMSEASTLLASSLDYETTLARVAELAVPSLADWCAIDMAGEDGSVLRLAVAHSDPSKVTLAHELQERFAPDPDAPYGVPNVIRTGKSELFSDIPDDLLVEATRGDEELLGILRELGLKSSMCVPLVARDRTLGAITFVTDQAERRFDESSLALAEELARRAAIAVDNALLYHEAERRGEASRVLAYVGDGVFLLDRNDVVRLWNPAAETITGLGASEVVGRPVAEAIPGWDSVAERVPVAIAPAPGASRAETVPLELADREVWLSISGVGFSDGIVYAFRDLTEERALERLKSDFVSTVSHELRTPLAAIYGASLTLRRSDVELSTEQRENLLDIVAGEADRLARTVNDILWASRLDSGTMQVSIGSCDGVELARGVISSTLTYVPEGIELNLSASPDLPPVAGDADKVRQVLMNLVDNAVKYSPDGGRVDVSLERRDGSLRFSVRDEGLGIPANEHSRIFDKFYRLDPNMTRGVNGTGLGLYICRELVRRMSGRIWVESHEGEGSTFSFELPVAES